MSVPRVLVCEAQIPFVRGGAESLVRSLVDQFARRGYDAALVSVPFKSYPKKEILSHAAAWRLLDLTESNGIPVDLVIATKFPTYFARHPNKVSWLIHQYRSAYELCGTAFGDFYHTERDVGLREQLVDLDGRMLGESRRVFTIARTTASRLARYNGLESEPLYHPPRLADRLRSGPLGDYVLSIGRLELIKRTDIIVRAMACVDPGVRLVIAGDGTQRKPLLALAEELGVGDRITFLGEVGDDDLIALYENALGVIYVPYDEDYGYVTLEAFLARRPVVTARDSGGTLEFVEHDTNGIVCDPRPEAIGESVNRLAASRARAAALGDAGHDRACRVTWDGVIEKLTGTA